MQRFLASIGLRTKMVHGNSNEFKYISKYIMRSSSYACTEYDSLKMAKLFCVSRAAEEEAFKQYLHLRSTLLLRGVTMNLNVRILQDGLRIHATPGPNGAPFGIGIYFATRHSWPPVFVHQR